MASKAYYQKNRERIIHHVTQYNTENKEAISTQRKQHYQKNKERIKMRVQKRRMLYPELIQVESAVYYQENKDDILEKRVTYYLANSEVVKSKVAEYRRNHPEVRVRANARRRTRILAIGGNFTTRQWKMLKAYYGYTCLCCGLSEPEIKLQADHVIPVSKSGSSCIENIQPLCKKCNLHKGSKIIDFRTNLEG